MNDLEILSEELILFGRLVELLYKEHKKRRAELHELHSASNALVRASKRYDKALLENYKRSGSANKDGDGVKLACKACGIKNTYKELRAFLN